MGWIVIFSLLWSAIPALSWGATISGTVRDYNGTPITGMRVSVDVFTGDPCGITMWIDWAETDPEDGTYSVVVPAGTYYLQTSNYETGYRNEWWTGGIPDPSDRDCSLANSITVASGDAIMNTDFKLDLDSDGDGIRDYDEINVYGTNPNLADTDGDGIHDGDELNFWGPGWNQDPDGDDKINLVDEDSDNDGYLDGSELFSGTDPTDSGSSPQSYLYDDFSGTHISGRRWYSREFVREVSGGYLVSKLGNADSGIARNGTNFQNPQTITSIKTEITIVTARLDTGADPISFARIGGVFYNTHASGGATGDIWAEVQIGNRGNGLEAFWMVEEALDDEGNEWSVIGSGTIIVPGTLNYGTAHTAVLAYDGGNNITFTVAGQTDSFAGPAYQREPVIRVKQLATGIDGGSESGTGYVHALFDDVYVNNGAATYDDFSSAPLDLTLWDSREIVREINDDHTLLLAAHSEGQREQSTLIFAESQPYVEANVLVKEVSEVFSRAVGRIRIDGYYFNDTHAPGEYNGYEGNVWAQVYIDLFDDGFLRAAGYVGKSMNADETDWADLYWEEFSLPIRTDREYILGIHYTGAHFVFKCKDNLTLEEQYKTYTIPASNQYPAYDQYTALRARTYGNGIGDGYMKVQVDDVHVGIEPPPSCPGDLDTDHDVDGRDLALFVAGGGSTTLEELAQDFGKTGCP